MARRSPDPFKVLIKVTGSLLKAAAAAERASQKAAAKSERERARAIREHEKAEKERERERERAFRDKAKVQKKNEADKLRADREALRAAEALRKDNERRRLQDEKEARQRQKQEESERKTFLREVKQELSLATIVEFNLNKPGAYSYKRQVDYSLEADIVALKNGGRAGDIQPPSIHYGEFVWSGIFNSVIGTKGMTEFESALDSMEKLPSEHEWPQSDVCRLILARSGIYFDGDIDRFRGDFHWLTAYRKLVIDGQGLMEQVLNSEGMAMPARSLEVASSDLERLREYLKEFTLKLYAELAAFHLKKSKIRLLA